MRVFLEQGQTVVSKRNVEHTYAGQAFYDVEPELAKVWLDAGIAKRATDDNKVIEPAAKPAEKPAPEAKPKDAPKPKKAGDI